MILLPWINILPGELTKYSTFQMGQKVNQSSMADTGNMDGPYLVKLSNLKIQHFEKISFEV